MRASLLVASGLLLLQPQAVLAHCDTLKGPVVTAARAALQAGDPALVLHWVRGADEDAVRSVFRHVFAVRRLGPEARELADRYFFETVVRLHREEEGAPYVGLSDADPDEGVVAVDRAVATGDKAKLEQLLVESVRANLERHFTPAMAAKGFTPGDVRAGRAYVAAYVPLMHWVEGVLAAAEGAGAPERHGAHAAPGEPPHWR
jgi:hypothetical protein